MTRSDPKLARPDPISMRLPEELKSKLTDAAQAAGRSLNAEIRVRLEKSFSPDLEANNHTLPTVVQSSLEEMEKRIAATNSRAIAEQFTFLEAIIDARLKSIK